MDFLSNASPQPESPEKHSLNAWGQEQGQCWWTWLEQSAHGCAPEQTLVQVRCQTALPSPTLETCSRDPGHACLCTVYHLCTHITALACSVWAKICTLPLTAHLDDNTDLQPCFHLRITLELLYASVRNPTQNGFKKECKWLQMVTRWLQMVDPAV